MAAIEHVKGSVTKFEKEDAKLEGTANMPEVDLTAGPVMSYA